MTAEALVSRLERVRRTGRDRWIARCPAHDDKVPSLSVRDLEDGRTLIHCFAGCDVGDVVAAVGLQLSELFPQRPLSEHRYRPERRPFPAHDILRCVAHEATVARLCSAALREGKALTDEDDERLALAMSRLMAAEELANGH